jgi:sugar phosphate isomerase/epimerase
MDLGFRISDNSYFCEFDLKFVQISVWHQSPADVERVRRLSNEVRKNGKRFVIHPFSLYLSETREEERKYYLDMLERYARIADLGLILHDETVPGVGPLSGIWEEAYRESLYRLAKICPVSIENGTDCRNVVRFWKTFANSIVFDIGHFEVAGMDCLGIMNEMGPDLLGKLDYVHLHRKGEMRENMGIRDHWPLEKGCPEILILKRLVELRPKVKVILEVDGKEDLAKSMEVLKLRD